MQAADGVRGAQSCDLKRLDGDVSIAVGYNGTVQSLIPRFGNDFLIGCLSFNLWDKV